MCQIIYVPPKGFFPWEHLKTIYDNNPDGFGMMWIEDGKVQYLKGLLSLNEIAKIIKHGPKTGVAYHFRYATRGIVDSENCHPFIIADDVGMMHNGTIANLASDGGASDTAKFAEALRYIYHAHDADYLFSSMFVDVAEDLIGSSNRVLFMGFDNETGKRRVRFLNRGRWAKLTSGEREVLLANSYTLQPGFRKQQREYALAKRELVCLFNGKDK